VFGGKNEESIHKRSATMPLIQVSIIEGRSAEQKETLIRRLTEVACEVLDSQPGQVRVIITEVKPEHWGIAGESVRAKRLRDDQGS
jgi:4-oxalocrotonate tautomerase